MSGSRPLKGLDRDVRAAELLAGLARTQRGIIDLQTRKVERDLHAFGSPAGLGSAFAAGAVLGLARGTSREEAALRKMDVTLEALDRRLGVVEKAHRAAKPSRGEQLMSIAKSIATSVAVRYLAGALIDEPAAPAAAAAPEAAASAGAESFAADPAGFARDLSG